MPRVNIYISNQDFEKWQAIKNKSRWVAEALADNVSRNPQKEPYVDKFGDLKSLGKGMRPSLRGPEPVMPIQFNATGELKDLDTRSYHRNGLCKIHGVPLDSRGKCLQKGCKYA